MLFNSYIFILVFFPIALIGYYGLNHFKHHEIARVWLIVLSLCFYAYFKPSYLFIILGSICINFFLAGAIRNYTHISKKLLTIGIIGNILILFCFKYINFTIDTINSISGTSLKTLNILMPLGISFYTFQQISFLADTYRGDIKKCSFCEYSLFVSFFPKLSSGPIASYSEMGPQFSDCSRSKFDYGYFSKGLFRFSVGLFKKVLLADTISKAVSYGYSNISALNLSEAWIVAILYSMQLYFDFSGYCDMAIGIANCFHLDLPENFNNPYFADSISEFWKRWHITLTNFLTKYVYIPLGGNRKGKSRTLLNILIVYLISGIWHGADWSFVFWGVLHGIACCFHRICGNIWGKIPEFLRMIGTFIYVTIAWVFFRADSMGDALSFIRVMFLGKAGGVSGEFLKSFDVLELVYIEDHVGVLNRLVSGCPTINMIIILMISTLALVMERTFAKKAFKPTFFTGVACFVFLLWSVLSLSGVSVFLYFNF